jgi:transcription initiation factor TFIIB
VHAQRKDPVSKCPDCNNNELVRDSETGEVICGKCGVVVSSRSIDLSPEWRAFTVQQKENLPRTGSPINLMMHDMGLSTSIGWRDVDGNGKRMTSSQKSKFYRLRKWNHRTRISESGQRNLLNALSFISNIGNDLNLPINVIETASSIYRKMLQKRDMRGRKIKSLAASAIYTACRQCNVIRTLNDIAENTDQSKKEIARTYRFMLKNIEADIPLFSNRQYISKYVNQLELHGETEIIALKLLSKASEIQLTMGRSQKGITASCIYIACQITDEKRTQTEIAKVAQVTEVTIRNRYKEIIDKLTFLIRI